jgi:hypothetical protein
MYGTKAHFPPGIKTLVLAQFILIIFQQSTPPQQRNIVIMAKIKLSSLIIIDSEPPSDFICPLTQKVMKVPVTTPEGIHYEKEAIEGWLRDVTYCPELGCPLSVESLQPNIPLQGKIQYWRLKTNDVVAITSPPPPHDSACGLPPKFLCPLAQDIMRDPVMTKTGYTFERSALAQWMTVCGEVCPVSGQPLPLSHIVSDRTLKQEIQFWRRNKNDTSRQQQQQQRDDKVSSSSIQYSQDHDHDVGLEMATVIPHDATDKRNNMPVLVMQRILAISAPARMRGGRGSVFP